MYISFELSVLFSAIPSFILLYLFWERFEDLFNERTFIIYIVTGFIVGAFASVFFLILDYSSYNYLDLSIIFVTIFAFFTELMKFIIFNRKKLRNNYELTFYSYGFGLGFGAVFSLSLLYYYLNYNSVQILDYLYILIFSFIVVIMHSSTSSMIGYGIFRKEGLLLRAILLQLAFNLTLLPYVWGFSPFFWIFGIVISIPLFLYIDKIQINALPSNLKRRFR